jgi:transcriptional regulator with XRE-family HTH domain
MEIIVSIMESKKVLVISLIDRTLTTLGENIRLARLRRKFSASLVSERVDISRPTLRAIERGDSGVSIGAYANVLLSLGLEKYLAKVASDDVLGRKLQDAKILVKQRAPKRRKEIE